MLGNEDTNGHQNSNVAVDDLVIHKFVVLREFGRSEFEIFNFGTFAIVVTMSFADLDNTVAPGQELRQYFNQTRILDFSRDAQQTPKGKRARDMVVLHTPIQIQQARNEAPNVLVMIIARVCDNLFGGDQLQQGPVAVARVVQALEDFVHLQFIGPLLTGQALPPEVPAPGVIVRFKWSGNTRLLCAVHESGAAVKCAEALRAFMDPRKFQSLKVAAKEARDKAAK